MAYVTIEEVAQYLADNGYTTWADLTRQQTLTVEGMWTRLQSQYDSTRAIDGRYLGLGAYATEASIKAWVQSQGYLTSVPSPDMSSYATQAWVLGRGYLTSHQSLNDYATKTWVGMQMSSLASQVWVGNNFVSKTAFDELFEKVNIGTEQSPVYAIHAKLGLYSDSFLTAGGIGTSGGGGGGGLSWKNLAASTTEQIALSHLTTALSGYVSLSSAQVISGAKDFTSRIKVSDVGDLYIGGIFYDSYDWVGLWSQHEILIQSESDVLIDGEHVDINSVSGTYVGGAVSLSSTLTASGQVTAKKFVATDYNSSDSLLRGDGTATSLLGLFSSMFVSGSTLYVTVGGTAKSVTLPSGLTSYGYRPIIGASGATTTWIDENYGVILPLTGIGGGNYGLDLSGVFTELTVSGTTLYATVGGTRKSVTLPGGMSAMTSRHYASRSAFLQTFTHVTDEYSVIQCVTVMATSGNDYLLAITLSDTEGQQFVIRATSGNKVLWKATTPNEQAITAIVWMNPSSYYTVEI